MRESQDCVNRDDNFSDDSCFSDDDSDEDEEESDDGGDCDDEEVRAYVESLRRKPVYSIWSFDLIGNHFRAARFPSETKSGLFLVMLAFCDFSFGPDSMLVLFRDAPPRCEPFLRQICLLFYSCSQSQRDFLFGGQLAHFAVGHQDFDWFDFCL